MAAKSLLECTFLIPIRRDANLSDGGLHRKRDWDWLKTELFQFGGATQAPAPYAGWYVDPDTKERVSDLSRKYFVAVPRSELASLRKLLREACVVFRRKCIYLSVAGEVEFIEGPDNG